MHHIHLSSSIFIRISYFFPTPYVLCPSYRLSPPPLNPSPTASTSSLTPKVDSIRKPTAAMSQWFALTEAHVRRARQSTTYSSATNRLPGIAFRQTKSGITTPATRLSWNYATQMNPRRSTKSASTQQTVYSRNSPSPKTFGNALDAPRPGPSSDAPSPPASISPILRWNNNKVVSS